MGTTTPWVGDAFFARERTPEQIKTIQAERIDAEAQAAMRAEAVGAKLIREQLSRTAEKEHAQERAIQLQREWMRLASERYHAATRVPVDEQAFGLLPAYQSGTVLDVKDPDEIRANTRAALAFFRRVDGRDLGREHDGYLRWNIAQQATTPEIIRWLTAPIDPITAEEAASVCTHRTARQIRSSELQRQRDDRARRLYVKGEVRPAGMTTERAEQIATAALTAIENGTTTF